MGAAGALPGTAGHKDHPAPTLRLEAPMPCRESQELWVGPEEGDEAVSLQQHAQERPPHEDNEDPPHEEAGALQLWPLEKESEGPPEADDEDQAGEEEDLGG